MPPQTTQSHSTTLCKSCDTDKQAGTHMNKPALNGCSEPENEIFTAIDTLWLLAFHDTYRVSSFKILALHHLYLTGAALIAVTTSFEIFAIPLSTE